MIRKARDSYSNCRIESANGGYERSYLAHWKIYTQSYPHCLRLYDSTRYPFSTDRQILKDPEMARADLLINLVKNGMQSDKVAFRKVVEAIIAEERSMQHKVLAEKLEETLNDKQLDLPSPNGHHISESRVGSLIHEILPNRRLQDLVLQDNVRQLCQEFIEEHHRVDLLRSYGLEPRNRILLIGPPGNGKTTLAEAVATELMVPLIVVRYENLVGTFLGETSNRLRRIFEFAVTRKCVLFFDEFETLGKERGDVHETGEIKRVVSSFLLQIDHLPSHVIIIGATNHSELLDRAVWRRFQVRLELPKPTAKEIELWLKKFEETTKVTLGSTLPNIIRKLNGLSFSEVEEFCSSILRRIVLAQPKANVKEIVNHQLEQLTITKTSDSLNPGSQG